MGRLFAGRGATVAVMGVLLALVAGGSYALAASGNKSITVCVEKKGGALYKTKKCKKHDSKLRFNQQGPAGKAGKSGANGRDGAPGAAGAPGVPGATGFVQIVSWEGPISDTALTGPSEDFVFAGPTSQVTTTSSQSVAASGSAALATSTSSADIELSICAQPATGGSIEPLATDPETFEGVTVTTTRIPYAISEAGTPGTGTFNIGMCVMNGGSQTVDANDWSLGYAFVTNSTLTVTDTDPMVKGMNGARAH